MTLPRNYDVFIPIHPTSRVGRWGRDIKCPHCNHIQGVGNFNWSALQCTSCNRMVDKCAYQMRMVTTSALMRTVPNVHGADLPQH